MADISAEIRKLTLSSGNRVSLLLGGRHGFICHYQQAFNPLHRFQAISQNCEKASISFVMSVRPNGTPQLPLHGFP